MGTSTAKLKLYRPAITGEAVDVQDLNDNMDKLEALLPFTICTSGARPASPFQGQTIFETDTGLVYFWTGAAWRKWIVDIASMTMTNGLSVGGTLTAAGDFDYVNTIGGKNPIHNPEFKIAQRGTTGAASTGSGQTQRAGLDRWTVWRSAFGAGVTWSKQTGGPSGVARNCARVQRDSGNAVTTDIYMSQAMETDDSIRFQSKRVTLSFWARKGANFSAASSLLFAYVRSGTGTDENYLTGLTGQADVIGTAVTLTTSWQRFTLTSASSVGAGVTQLAAMFAVAPVGTAGAADYYEVTGIQLEEGLVDTAYEPVTVATELARCQRYVYRHTGATGDRFGAGVIASATSAVVFMPMQQQMRAAPNYVSSATGVLSVTTGTVFAGSANSSSQSDANAGQVGVTITGGTSGQGCLGFFNAAGWIDWLADI